MADLKKVFGLRPSKGGFDVALSLVYQSTCRLFGKGQMSLSLFRYNTNVAVVLSFYDAVSNLYNLVLLVPVSVPCEQLVSPTKPTAQGGTVSEDQPHICLRIT